MRFSQIKVNEGISHIENLAVEDFINAMRNFGHYEISEKVDGSNLQFGLDDEGFYTSREAKNGNRVRDVDDYPISYNTTFIRSAHLALEKILPIMVKVGGLRKGDRVEIEVLYGELPNAIRYTSEENRIIFLRTVEGNADINDLRDSLGGRKVSVELTVPYTTDGRTIEEAREINIWSFEKTPTISGEHITQSEAMKTMMLEVDAMEEYLLQDSGIGEFSNAELLALPLNKRPDSVNIEQWKELKVEVKDKKQEIQKELYHEAEGERIGFKARIKDILLNELVRKEKSGFGPEVEDGGWIEGVVFSHKGTGEMFKIVDKDMFTTVNKFNYTVRKSLSEKPSSIKTVQSFLGELLTSMASALGHTELGTIQAKRHLKKHGSAPEEILANLSNDVDFNQIQDYWLSLIDQKEQELLDKLNNYHNTKGDHELVVDFGGQERKFYYDGEIDKRTLQTFSQIFQMMEEFKSGVTEATSVEDLIVLLVGKQLSEI